METVLSKELHFISKVSHYFSKDIVLLFELISLLSEPISLRFLCFVTLRNEIFRKGILLQMARHIAIMFEFLFTVWRVWRLIAISAIFAKYAIFAEIATFQRAPLSSHLNFC